MLSPEKQIKKMKKKDLIILTAGENARLVSNLIKNKRIISNFNVVGYLDDDAKKLGKKYNGVEVLGLMQDWRKFSNTYFTSPLVSSPKSNHKKIQTIERLKISSSRYANIVSSELLLPNSLSMDNANLILSGTEFQNKVKIGSHVYISNNAVICSNTSINDYANISNSVSIQGGVIIDEGAYIGANSSIIGYSKIGRWSIIGMGSVVLNDVEEFQIIAGNPAKVIGINQEAKDYFAK